MDLTALYRSALLGTAGTPFVKKTVTRYGWRVGVGRFVAGEDFASALPALRQLEGGGRHVILDLLGEFVSTEEAARETAARIVASVGEAAEAGVSRYFSVKPTQLGLGVDHELAFELADTVASALAGVGGRLCLDMEDVPSLGPTLDLYERLLLAGHVHVSTVLQAYLHRTPDDLARVIDLANRTGAKELRLVKGAYKEKPEDAIQDRPGIAQAYRQLVYTGFGAGLKLNLATHDEPLLRELLAYVKGAGLTPEQYEVQMLFGVRNKLQEDLAAAGHPVRVYVPFGDDWYGYFSRRLAERPANLAFVVRGLFG